MSLTDLWKTSRGQLKGKHIQQLLPDHQLLFWEDSIETGQ